MIEAQRFLRYVIPGFLFVILTFIYVWIIQPGLTICIINKVLVKENNPVAIIIGAIVTSGALGYLFATLHHWYHWHFDKDVINHTKHIQHLHRERLIDGFDMIEVDPRNSQREALIKISVLWFERLNKNNPIGISQERVLHYGNLAHAAGTARIAALFALIMAVSISMRYGETCSCISYGETCGCISLYVVLYALMLAFGIFVIYVFHNAWVNTGTIYQHLNEQLLERTLRKEPFRE